MNIGAAPWTRSDISPGFEVVLHSVAGAGETSRRLVDGLAEVLPASTLSDLRTVVTELVNNSVRHGSGDPITLEIDVTPGGLTRGAISDGGLGPVGITPAPKAPEEGLGLRIVDALASRWGVNPPSSDVWFELAPVS